MPFRILHVTNYFRDTHRHVGGAEQACYRTALLCRDRGATVAAFTVTPDIGMSAEFTHFTSSVIEDFVPRAARPYLEAAKWYALQWDPIAAIGFHRALRNFRPDVVHFHNCQFLTLGLLAEAERFGAKTVVSVYDYWLFCPIAMLQDADDRFCAKAHGRWCTACLPKQFPLFQKALLTLRRPVMDRLIAKADAFHALSRHSAGVVEGYGIPAEKIHTIPLSLPMDFGDSTSPEEPADPRMIFFAGWLNQRKGLHRLLEAMPLALREHPEAHLVVAGDPVRFGEEYRALLSRLIDEGGLGDKVAFLGHVPPQRVRRLIMKSAVVVIPEQYQNMSPLLMIETMYLGKPLVISRVGGVPEFVEDGVTGWLAAANDPAEFARKIGYVLSHPDEAAEVGATARVFVTKKCDPDRIASETLFLYEQLLTVAS
jgi:glycosyltransferase involved in cell wall biosynthesis